MLVDGTSLFHFHKNIKTFFGTVNCKLQKLCEWFRANKLSLNVIKTNFTFFHKNSTEDEIPLKMTELKIGNSMIKRKSSVNFSGVM